MTAKPSLLESRLAAATARLQSLAEALPKLKETASVAQRRLSEAMAQFGTDSHPGHELLAARGDAKNALRHAESAVVAATADHLKAQQEVAHLERLVNANEDLEKARANWTSAFDAQIEAAKVVEAAGGNLRKLDAMLSAEEAKSDAAKEAQRVAILRDLGFGEEEKGGSGKSAAEKALVGSAATIDALKSARPELVRKVAEAEALLSARDVGTRAAVRAILEAKKAIAEGQHMLALEAYRAAFVDFRGASLAATGRHLPPINVFEGLRDADYEAVAQRLKASAEQGA